MRTIRVITIIAIVILLAPGCAKRKLTKEESKEAFNQLSPMVTAGNLTGLVSKLKEKPRYINAKDSYDGTTLLHIALLETRKNKMEIVQLLVEKGANINETNTSGETALHNAVWGIGNFHGGFSYEKIEIIKFLVANGADLEIKDCRGRTPLTVARNFMDWAVIRNLDKIEEALRPAPKK